jgi:alpha-galactosidase
VIAKGEVLYYAFYARQFSGALQLRGLHAGNYRVRDYVHDRDLGHVRGPTARLTAQFQHALLIEVRPE